MQYLLLLLQLLEQHFLKAGGAMTGAITTNSTFDGRDVATDGSKLDGIESGATADQTQSEINALGITATGLSGTPAISVANITTTGELRGPASFTIDPAAVGDNTGTVIIKGNLQVDGATTTINSTTLTVDDLNLTLASGAANGTAANGAGITIDGASATLTYQSTGDNWAFNKNLDVTGNIVVSGTVDGVDIAARDAVLTSTTTTAGAALPKAGGTMTGNLNLGNNIKAQFGAGNDLQIYHNAGTSFITESGSSNLKIGGENLYLQNTAHNENYLAAIANQGVTLYYNNLAKIATTSTGIDVTGTADVTLDLNVGGAVKGNAGTRAVSVGVAGSVVGGLQLWSTTAGTSYVQFGDEAGTAANHYRGYMSYSHANDSMALGTSGNTKVTVSSAGNVGIGVVPKVWHSSAAVLQIGSGGSLEASTTNESRVFLQANAYRNASNVAIVYRSTDEASQYWQNAGKHIFEVAPSGTADAAISWTTAMTIDNSGNVGIGTDSPAAKLHIENGDMRIEKDTKATIGFRAHTTGSTALAFRDSSAAIDRMTIDASGNVGIGLTPTDFANRKSLDIGLGGKIWGHTSATETGMGSNFYFDGAYKRTSANAATRHIQDGNGHTFDVAASGSADATISWTTAMLLDAAGKVGIGTIRLLKQDSM